MLARNLAFPAEFWWSPGTGSATMHRNVNRARVALSTGPRHQGGMVPQVQLDSNDNGQIGGARP